MLITLFKGILIGIIISAPLGPVGALCLRETLYGGQREGMLTGIGATLSDVLYGFLVYLGVGLVLDFVAQHDASLRLLGGIIILVFGFLLYRKAQTGEIKQSPTKRLSRLHGFRKVVTAFFVTIANPFIMLLILPLYTRFQFVRETSTPILELSTALLGLAIGCMLWWYILTSGVQYLRRRTGHGGIRIISRSIAILLAVLGLIGIYTGTSSILYPEAEGAGSNALEELQRN